jgi:hypothetical protein
MTAPTLTLTRDTELIRPSDKTQQVAAALSSKKSLPWIALLIGAIVISVVIPAAVATAEGTTHPIAVNHPIGVIGFNGNGLVTENMVVDGIHATVEAQLNGLVLTTTSTSKYGTHVISQTIGAGSFPIAFAVPTSTKPLLLESIVTVRNG